MERMHHKSLFAIPGIMLLCLAGCASYRAKPLHRLTIVAPDTHEQFISFAYAMFSREDCKNYLDRDVMKAGYQPIHISLTNNTKRTLFLSLKNLSVSSVPADEVARKVHLSVVDRAVGYGVAGLFIWPFIIPAIVDSTNAAKANEHLDADFSHKALHDQIIRPYSTINGLVFIPKEEFTSDFTLTLTDTDNHDRFVLGTTQPRISTHQSEGSGNLQAFTIAMT